MTGTQKPPLEGRRNIFIPPGRSPSTPGLAKSLILILFNGMDY